VRNLVEQHPVAKPVGKRNHNTQNPMKNIKTLMILAVLGIAISALACAHIYHGALHEHGSVPFTDAASAVEHLTEFFPKFAAFDLNKDGRLDTTEQQSLAKSIADGALQLPGHPSGGATAVSESMLNHFADMYARFAVYDANHNGTLDPSEQTALQIALEKGEVTGPHGSKLSKPAESHP
jgi:hypothetical protein